MPAIRIALFWWAFLAFAGLGRAEEKFALSGYLRSDNVIRVVLVDRETGQPSPWLFIGDLFQGFMVMRFDVTAEVLTLQRGETVVQLPLGVPRGSARAELQVRVLPNGDLTLEGRPTVVSALATRLKELRAGGQAVDFEVRTQPGVDSVDAVTSLVVMLRDSGTDKWTVRIIDVTAKAR